MRRNEVLSAVIAELQSAHLDYNIEQTRKHIKIRYGPLLASSYVVSSTPSDGRARLNARADIRRAIREYTNQIRG